MKRKYKMTGCARFFIVLLFLAPLAYLGAAYYNGENGIENIKKFLNIGQSDTNKTQMSGDQMSIDKLQEQMKKLEEENRKLRREVTEKEAEIKALKKISETEGQ